MKKIIFILLVNIILIFLIEVLSGIYIFQRDKQLFFGYYKISNKIPPKNMLIDFLCDFSPVKMASKEQLYNAKRPIEIRGDGKEPIILFGCSFVEGCGLKENQTFSYKLANYLNKTVINRGHAGIGISYFYWQLNQEELMSTMPEDTSYVIYNFIGDHLLRLYMVRACSVDKAIYPKYRIKNNDLQEIKRNLFFHQFFSAYLIENFLMEKQREDYKKTKKMVTLLFNKSNEKIKKRFPNAKFAIIVMEKDFDYSYFDELDKDIKIIRVPYLEKKYLLEDNVHPNEKWWDYVVPYISEELEIKKQ